MLSQKVNVAFAKDQPKFLIGKILSGAATEKMNVQINEIRDGLSAINMVSLVGAMAYKEWVKVRLYAGAFSTMQHIFRRHTFILTPLWRDWI